LSIDGAWCEIFYRSDALPVAKAPSGYKNTTRKQSQHSFEKLTEAVIASGSKCAGKVETFRSQRVVCGLVFSIPSSMENKQDDLLSVGYKLINQSINHKILTCPFL